MNNYHHGSSLDYYLSKVKMKKKTDNIDNIVVRNKEDLLEGLKIRKKYAKGVRYKHEDREAKPVTKDRLIGGWY